MIKVYGIKNCDTMKKAFTWLDKNKIAYTFHDYKKSQIDATTIQLWLKSLSLDVLINSKGITFKKLTDEEKAATKNTKGAIALMMEKTSMIKRPLVEMTDGEYLLGFEEAAWEKAFKK